MSRAWYSYRSTRSASLGWPHGAAPDDRNRGPSVELTPVGVGRLARDGTLTSPAECGRLLRWRSCTAAVAARRRVLGSARGQPHGQPARATPAGTLRQGLSLIHISEPTR